MNDVGWSQSDSAWRSVHPATSRDRDMMRQIRAVSAANKGRLRGVAARPVFDELIGKTPAPTEVTWREASVGGVPGVWCEPARAPEDVAIFHLHGGWFNWGTARAFRNLVGHIAKSANVRAFVPDYRLAPEAPYPAGLEDVRACYRGLVASGFRAIAVTGDSAGGNLALGLMTTTAHPLANLAGAVVLSPVTDLTMSGQSWTSRADLDPFFVREQADALIAAYAAGHDRSDPALSPLFGGFEKLPPLRVLVGNDEVLLDDSLDYARRAVAAGVDARVDVWMAMAHGFIGRVDQFDAARMALAGLGDFLAGQLRA